jgi:uncharacterized membrane protein YqgA involved in biofilm formation
VNAAAIVAGGAIGLIFKKKIKESFTENINKSLGLAILIIGLNGVISNMFSVGDGKIASSGELLLVVFLVIGTLIGELLRLEDRFTKFSDGIEKKMGKGGFSSGFISSTLLFCIGAMAIIGALNDGLKGDSSILFVKSALDFTTAIILGATVGFGVMFSSIPILIYQGGITLLAGLLSPLLSDAVIAEMTAAGSVLIIGLSLNMLGLTKIKVANYLPAIFLPILFCTFM